MPAVFKNKEHMHAAIQDFAREINGPVKPERMIWHQTDNHTIPVLITSSNVVRRYTSTGLGRRSVPTAVPDPFHHVPDDLTTLLGGPNSQNSQDDGTKWVHAYNYKHPHAFSMRGDPPDATSSFLDFIDLARLGRQKNQCGHAAA